MHYTMRVILALLYKVVIISANTYTVKIGADHHVNLVDSRFLSFTIDPKYLFSSSGKYNSKECICMASALTPAYIRIAGPSTGLMSYHNSSISIDPQPPRSRFHSFFSDNLARIDEVFNRDERRRKDGKEEGRVKRNQATLEVSHSQWKRFVHWAKSTGFDLVFAVNNQERMRSGMWDPNMALNILTVAEKAEVGDIFWQLGYECTNQSIEEYLNDLETLRVIIETFSPGRSGQWKVVGADVTGCLHQDSKSDFKDYVSLSSDMMDAILLNGNSSTAELDRMSERDRLKLLKLLSHSSTPLWLTERPWPELTEISRAADWLTSLGHAARNGFAVHYRELDEEEMFQPTLSFYMALLFKNLVGEKVLHIDMQPEQAIMFAHCTSLRHKEVPGAVTLYGVNMDDEPARFSVKLAKREEGGDVMQFVMGHDKSGNVIVNGKRMFHEGDIKPVVKRVRPYKSLLINLPAKSFGFWVLANTKIEACFADEKYNETENMDDAVAISEEKEIEDMKAKRSINVQDFEEYTNSEDSVDFCDENEVIDEITDKDLKDRVNNINEDLSKVEALFQLKSNQKLRTKRYIGDDNHNQKVKKFRQGFKNRNVKSEPEQKPRRLIENLLKNKYDITKYLKSNVLKIKQKLPIFNKNKLSKRQSDTKPKKTFSKRKENNVFSKESLRNTPSKSFEKEIYVADVPKNKEMKRNSRLPKQSKNIEKEMTAAEKPSAEDNLENKSKDLKQYKVSFKSSEAESDVEEKVRTRRNTKDQVDLSTENAVDIDGEDNVKLWKMLRKIHKQFKDLSEETDDYVDDTEDDSRLSQPREDRNEDVDLGDDTTFIKKTVYSLLKVISDLNKNLNRFWNGMRLID